jgi:large subunit ribosomal protein L25
VPIRARYDEGNDVSPAERNSLIVLQQLETVEIKAVPSMLPDVLEYDGEKLIEVGDHVTAADLTIPKGVELVTDLDHTIATVFEPSALAAANDAAGGDAEEGDEQAVDSDVTPGTVEESTEGDEQRPGGKKEAEDHDQATNPTKK